MKTELEDKNLKEEKSIIIYLNGEEKEVKKEKISYEDVIILAFGHYEDNNTATYTVTYFKGNNHKPNGFLIKGQEVMVKKGMRINVTRTNRS